jgi:hypothetical protein
VALDVDPSLQVVGPLAFEAEPLDEVLEAGGVAAGAEEEDEPAEAFCTPP